MPWDKNKYSKVAVNTCRSLSKKIDSEKSLRDAHKRYIEVEDYESAKAIKDVMVLFDMNVKNLT